MPRPSPTVTAGSSGSPSSPPRVRVNEPGYGWLGAVAPAGAKRYRVADSSLAEALASAGAELVDVSPDVEIGAPADLQGDALLSIAVLGGAHRSGHPPGSERPRAEPPLPLRFSRRLVNALRVRRDARQARRHVQRLGYEHVESWLWDHRMVPVVDGLGAAALRSRLRESLPQRALVIGERSERERTILDDVLVSATRATGHAFDSVRPLVRTGQLIVETETGILRIAVGTGRGHTLGLRRAGAELHSLPLPASARRLIPAELAGGTCGLAEWSLEARLPGSRPGLPLPARLLSECIDFLVELHAARRDVPVAGAFLDQGAIVEEACPAYGAGVRTLAETLELSLARLPRAFVHGDFFAGNLLVDHGALAGVVDWEAAGPGRLPAVDLLHLLHTSRSELADADWGPLLVERLLPSARAGGGEFVRRYCRVAGVDFDTNELEALVFAYWLDYVSSQLRARPHLAHDPVWIDRGIGLVLREFDSVSAAR